MNKILVIGIGSLIMTDDSLGTRVAEAVQGRLREQDIRVLAGETDYDFCFGEIRPEDFLVILDAVMLGREPGSIEVIPLSDALSGRAGLQTQHDFSLFDAISLHYPEMRGAFIGIEAAELGFGFDLSQALEAKFDGIVEQVFQAVLDMEEALRHA
jgi:hydrogenase maturation protease